ncbi:MAG: hypothetical protein AAFQ94_00480 [Bacteroidota bacterium]
MADINVTMTVDTVKLQGTGGTPANSCILSDDNGDTPGGETFEIDATSGQTVQFTITAKDNTTAVSFVDFIYEGGISTVFNPLPSLSNNWTGTATGTVGQSESYYIDFNVAGTQYRLDPQIQIKSGG